MFGLELKTLEKGNKAPFRTKSSARGLLFWHITVIPTLSQKRPTWTKILQVSCLCNFKTSNSRLIADKNLVISRLVSDFRCDIEEFCHLGAFIEVRLSSLREPRLTKIQKFVSKQSTLELNQSYSTLTLSYNY